MVATQAEVIQAPELGIRVEVRRNDGDLLEIDVIGRPRGFLTQPHVHTRQVERHEVVSGRLNLVINGSDHVLGPGEAMEVPAGTAHRQLPAGEGDGHVRIQVRPPGTTLAFLQRLAELCREGRITRSGYPRPVAAAELIRDFGEEGHAARPPLPVQQAFSRAVLWARDRLDNEYVFVDEWDVAAPPQAVFDTIADGRTYPAWWRPVYIGVQTDGEPALGRESRQHFRGRLPYHLHTRTVTSRLEPPRVVEGEVHGDLRGRGTWTLTEIPGGTHVRFEWRVLADRPLLRALTPLLRPALRWNHKWAIARAVEGLEPYARSRSSGGA